MVKPQLKLTTTERDAQNNEIVKDVTGTEFQLDRNKSKRLTAVVSPLYKDYAKMDMSKVSWTSDTPSIASVSRTSGEFADVQGKDEGSTKVNASLDNVTASATVKVLGMRSFDPVNVATKTGTAPVFPGTVKVTWTDGTQTTEKVTWDSVALSQYRNPGTFKVNGKLNGSDIQVYATVTVSAYVLTFDANGGSFSITSRDVAYGDKYGKLPTATRSGYSLLGWYTEKSGGKHVTKDNVMGAADVTVCPLEGEHHVP